MFLDTRYVLECKIWHTYLNMNHDLNVVCFWALVSAIHHSSLVTLVLNLGALYITPQYHGLYDDWFQTVDRNLPTETFENAWCDLFDNNRYHYEFDEDDAINFQYDSNDWDEPQRTVDYSQNDVSRELMELQREQIIPVQMIRIHQHLQII